MLSETLKSKKVRKSGLKCFQKQSKNPNYKPCGLVKKYKKCCGRYEFEITDESEKEYTFECYYDNKQKTVVVNRINE